MTRRTLGAVLALAAPPLFAADPVVIRLSEKADAAAPVVTLAHVATVSGGDARLRSRLLDLDVADRDAGATVSKRQVEWRLKLAGFRDDDYVLLGADRVAVGTARKPLSVDRVVAVAKVELARRLGKQPDDLFLDVVQPVVVKLPDITAGDDVDISAAPNNGVARIGRTQMNVTVRVNGEQKVSLPVHLFASVIPTVVPAKGEVKADAPTAEVLVKARQRVTMSVRVGELVVGTIGEAMQDGKLGQPIQVRNVDSKKVVTGTVSGPAAVDVEPGGGR